MDHSNEPNKEQSELWRKDPKNWIFGIFYFNKEDKRLLPPKRIRYFGWTINFANPLSILMLVIIIFLSLATVELIANLLN